MQPRRPAYPIRRALAALVLVVVPGALHGPASPAAAHTGADPEVRVVLDGVEPPLPAGVTFQVRPSVVAQLVAANSTPTELTVLAVGGEPFLRLGTDGALVNLASPDWYDTNQPEGQATPPADVQRDRGTGTPRYARVNREPAWGWFDHRLHPPGAVVPSSVREAGRDAVLSTWSVPVRYGGVAHTLRGRVLFTPVLGTFRVDPAAAPAGLEVAALQGSLPGLFLRLASGASAVVLGRDGEPFLRLTPQGVEVNTASGSWFDDQRARGQVPDGVPGGATTWRQVSTSPGYAWLDPRLRYPEDRPPRDVLVREEVTEVQRWSVPVVLDGAPTAVTGAVTWVPTAQARAGLRPGDEAPGAERATGSDGPAGPADDRRWLGVVGLVVGLGVAGAVLLARRRRSGPGGPGGIG